MVPAYAWRLIGSYFEEQKTYVNPFCKKNIEAVQAPNCDRSANRVQAVGAVRDRSSNGSIARGLINWDSMPQAPTCGRSGGAAGAVRGRSLWPRPVAVCSDWRAVWRAVMPFQLTPARFFANRLVSQLVGVSGTGASVACATTLQPPRNYQNIEIIAYSCAVARLRAASLRYACGRVCVHGRAYVCARRSATMQPLLIYYIYQYVSGCTAVATWLRVQPAVAGTDLAELDGAQPNILGLGYSDARPSGRIRGNSEAVRRESFRVFEGGSGDLGAVGRNGGFPPFCGGVCWRVGRVMLEGWSYPSVMHAVFCVGQKPVRLTAGRGEMGATATRRAARGPRAAGRFPQHGRSSRRPQSDPIFRNRNSFQEVAQRRPKLGLHCRVGVSGASELGCCKNGSGKYVDPAATHLRRDSFGETWGITCQ